MTEALIYGVASPKLPMVLEGRNVVGLGGFGGCGEISEMPCFPIRFDLGYPSPVPLTPGNSAYSALGIPRWTSTVRPVLSVSRLPEIISSAVKAVIVDVVNTFLGESKNKRVEKNSPYPSLRDVRPDIKVSRGVMNKPLEAANNVLVLIVDKCRLSLSQRYLNHYTILANLTEMETNPPGIKMTLKEA